MLGPSPARLPLLDATTAPYRVWARTSARSQVRERRPAVDDVVDALLRARELAQGTGSSGAIGVLVIDAAGFPLWGAGEDLRDAVADALDLDAVDAPPTALDDAYETGWLQGADAELRAVDERGATPIDEHVARRRAQLDQAAVSRGVVLEPLGVAEPEIVRVPLREDVLSDAPDGLPLTSVTVRWRLIVAAPAGAWEPQGPLGVDVDRDEALRELARRCASAAVGERWALQEQSTIVSGWQTIA